MARSCRDVFRAFKEDIDNLSGEPERVRVRRAVWAHHVQSGPWLQRARAAEMLAVSQVNCREILDQARDQTQHSTGRPCHKRARPSGGCHAHPSRGPSDSLCHLHSQKH